MVRLLEKERQQTMMSLVSDKAFVFYPEVTEESSGVGRDFIVGPEIDNMWMLESSLWGWSIS